MGDNIVQKTTGAEFLSQQLLKFAVDPNPIAALINAFCDGLNIIQMNNIIDVLKDLKARVELIEEKTGEKLRFDTPVFTDDIIPTLQKAKNILNAQKRKLYVTFLAACVHPDNLDCNNKAIFSNFLDQLDYLSIYILNSLETYCSERKLIEKIGADYNEDTILVHLWNLNSIGLVEKISANELEQLQKRFGNRNTRRPQNIFFYKRNNLGNGLLQFVLKGNPPTDNTD